MNDYLASFLSKYEFVNNKKKTETKDSDNDPSVGNSDQSKIIC